MTLTEIVERPIVAAPEHWTITDRNAAIWAARQLFDARQRMDAIDTEVAEAIAPLQAQIDMALAWAANEKKDAQTQAEFFEGHLTRWHAAQREADPKVTSIKLPWATLASRKSAPKLEITDEHATLEALKEAGRTEFVRVKEELDKTALKTAVFTDGEKLPGVTVAPETITYTVKVIDTGEVR